MSARIVPCIMIIAASLCMLGGWWFTLVGVDNLHAKLLSYAKPVELTCSQLHTYQPGNNTHITLTGFVPYPDGILAFKYKNLPSWSVWVPVLSADAPQADPKNIVAVVRLSGVSDKDTLWRKLDQPRWTGVLRSEGDLGIETADFCRLNPGVHLESCWVMWEGYHMPELAGVNALLVTCPCLFVLGMILAVRAALRPDAVGDAVRRVLRRRVLSVCTTLLLAAVGVVAVGGGSYLVHRDWNTVANVTTEMHLAILGGLIGLGLLAYAALVVHESWKTEPAAPASSPYVRVQGGNIPDDPLQWAGALIFLGFFMLLGAGSQFYRSSISRSTFLGFAAIGGLSLIGGAIWYGFLRRKKQQEPAHFWNEIGPTKR